MYFGGDRLWIGATVGDRALELTAWHWGTFKEDESVPSDAASHGSYDIAPEIAKWKLH